MLTRDQFDKDVDDHSKADELFKTIGTLYQPNIFVSIPTLMKITAFLNAKVGIPKKMLLETMGEMYDSAKAHHQSDPDAAPSH